MDQEERTPVKPGDTIYAVMTGSSIVYGTDTEHGAILGACSMFHKGNKYQLVKLQVVEVTDRSMGDQHKSNRKL
jgi:hypothetical protein